MKTLSVGEFKTRFSEVLAEVRVGASVGVSFGRKADLVAVLVPPEAVLPRQGLKLGLLQGSATFRTQAGFKMADQELLSS